MTFRSKREATETLRTQVLKMLKKKKFLVGNYDYGDQTIEEYLPENAAIIFCENNHIDVELRKNGGVKVEQRFEVWHRDFTAQAIKAEYAEKAAYIYCEFLKLYEKIWSGNPEEYITVVAENGDKTIFRLAFDRWACGEVLTKLLDPQDDAY